MGIQGLGTLLRRRCPEVFKDIATTEFRGKRIAMDMHLIVYQLFFRNGGSFAATVADLRRLIARLQKDCIEATCVFDGKTAGKKPRAHKIRKQAFQRSKDQLETLECSFAVIDDKIAKACYDLAKDDTDGSALSEADETSVGAVTKSTDDVVGEVAEVVVACTEIEIVDIGALLLERRNLDAKLTATKIRVLMPSFELFETIKLILIEELGMEAVVVAEDDGERHVASLCSSGKVDFAISSDYDTLAFGSPNLVINFLHPSKTAIILLEDVLLGLKLPGGISQFRDFCILCGCDFCDKVPGIGPVTALRHIQTYTTIENMYAAVLEKRIQKTNDLDFNYGFARSRLDGSYREDTEAVAVSVSVPVPSCSPLLASFAHSSSSPTLPTEVVNVDLLPETGPPPPTLAI